MPILRRFARALRDDRGDFIENAIWIVIVVLAMIPLFTSLRGAISNAFTYIIGQINSLR